MKNKETNRSERAFKWSIYSDELRVAESTSYILWKVKIYWNKSGKIYSVEIGYWNQNLLQIKWDIMRKNEVIKYIRMKLVGCLFIRLICRKRNHVGKYSFQFQYHTFSGWCKCLASYTVLFGTTTYNVLRSEIVLFIIAKSKSFRT